MPSKFLTLSNCIYILVIVTLLVFANSLINGFVWDDEEQIVNNTIIHTLQNFPQIFSGATFNTGGAGLSGWFFRPFLTLTFMLNYALWGENAFGFHLFQLLLHIFNTILVLLILRALNPPKSPTSLTPLISLFLSLVFAIHPAISETVVYISAISDTGSVFFALLSFYLVSKTNTKPSPLKLTIIFFTLISGFLYKESLVVIYPILASYLIIFKNRYWKNWSILLATSLVFYFTTRLIFIGTPIRHPEFSPISEASLIERLQTIPAIFSHYLTIFIYPARLAVSQHFVTKTLELFNFYLPLLITLSFLVLMPLLSYLKRSKLLIFGYLWFIFSLSIVLNIFPLDMTVADRWFYLPIVGLLIILLGLSQILKPLLPPIPLISHIFLIFALILSVALCARTIQRNSNWYNGLSLYSNDINISKASFDLENNLGVELYRIGKIPEAKTHFQNSISLQPKWHYAYNNLGAVYQSEKDYQNAEMYYKKTLELSDYFLAHENLANLALIQGDFEKAKQRSEESLKKLPQNPNLWTILTISSYKLGDKELSLKAAENAFYLKPTRQNQTIYYRIKEGQELFLGSD